MNPPGISIVARAPLWGEDADTWHLTQKVHNYNHVIEAMGGYGSASFTIRGGRSLVDDWLQDGLGRHVEVYADSLTKIWEGFANRLTVNYGPLGVTRGPLLDIANRVLTLYTAHAYDEDGNPIAGTRAWTTDYADTASQELWGIVPEVLTAGSTLEDADAARIGLSYLSNNATPRTSKHYRSDADSETSVTVDCLGYVKWLNYPYILWPAVGTDNASDKIIDVLADTPNVAWLAYDTTHIDENTIQVVSQETDRNIAWNIIKDIVSQGDVTFGRWLFGVYADLEAFYHAAPTTVEYQQRLSQSRPKIEIAGGDQVYEVYPWSVVPGKWIMFPDFLIGQAAELNLRDDPRAMFIEQVKYTAPWGLALKGGSVDTVSAVVAQLGLSGIGA